MSSLRYLDTDTPTSWFFTLMDVAKELFLTMEMSSTVIHHCLSLTSRTWVIDHYVCEDFFSSLKHISFLFRASLTACCAAVFTAAAAKHRFHIWNQLKIQQRIAHAAYEIAFKIPVQLLLVTYKTGT